MRAVAPPSLAVAPRTRPPSALADPRAMFLPVPWSTNARAALVVTALAPAAGLAYATGAVADWVGRSLGTGLSGLLGTELTPMGTSSGEASSGPRPEGAPASSAPPAGTASTPADRPRTMNGAAGARRRTAPERGLRVSAEAVLRLASAGARPAGSFVPASATRPAGLALTGVGGLGVGLRDGDVLTEAAGTPALSPGDVVSVVIAARGRNAQEVSGVFWRDGEPWALVVEQPYLTSAQRGAGARDRSAEEGSTGPSRGRVSMEDGRRIREAEASRRRTASYASVR